MPKTKIREIILVESSGSFNVFKKSKTTKQDYDFLSMKALRSLLSNEKARILHTIKEENPSSIYQLAKRLKRTFKSVYTDLMVLERFGFIEFVEERTKDRIRHKPKIIVDQIVINFKI